MRFRNLDEMRNLDKARSLNNAWSQIEATEAGTTSSLAEAGSAVWLRLARLLWLRLAWPLLWVRLAWLLDG